MNKKDNMKIRNIYWENNDIIIEILNASEETKISIISDDKKELIDLIKIEFGIYKLNIVNPGNNKILDNSNWLFANEKKEKLEVDIEFVNKIKQIERVFWYGDGKYSYIISLNLINDTMLLGLRISFMIKNKKPKALRTFYGAENINQKTSFFIRLIEMKVIILLYNILSFLHINNGKNILFMSETRTPISGNLKALYDYMEEEGISKDYNIRFSFRKVLQEKPSIFKWIKLIFLIAKQDYIFIDDYAPIFGFLNLSKKTKLIQLWHAGIGFKEVGYARFGENGSPHPYVSCHRKYDYVFVGSEAMRDIYKDVFGINCEQIIATGLPRLDNYLKEEKISVFKDNFYTEYPYLKNKKIILFAPTYRGKGQKTAYYDYSQIDFKKFDDVCDKDTVILFKFHPFIIEKIEIPEKYLEKFFDFSTFADINELFYITDILITDYSSNIYEFSLYKKPILFFDYDKEIYKAIQGIHFNLEDYSPGEICNNFDELVYNLKNEKFNLENANNFRKKYFDFEDNKACERIIKIILGGK